MPAFDFSGIRAKSAPDYGFLVDQLDIKRNQLESDGKLSPGDYDLLTKQAQQIFANPSLTPAQRSNVLVKISQYKSEKQTSSQKDLNDISRLNNSTQDDMRKNVMLFGNNPRVLLQANADALRMKIDRLSQSIDQLNYSGADASNHINEYNDTLGQYNDVLQAMDDVKNFKTGGKPTSNYVAYVTTNSKGEVTDVNVGKTGSKTGYAETNGLYGGLQIYGKVNRKEFGKNIFVIGNDTFSGSDLTIQDPTTPGAFRSAPLLSQGIAQGKNFGVIPDQFKSVDLTQTRTQTAIPAGGFAQGANGFLYERLPNGQYKKYVNTTPEKLGVSPNNIIKIPGTMEQYITPSVTETIDGSKPFNPVSSAPFIGPQLPPAASSTQPSAQSAPTTQGGGTSRTPGPTTRSPQDAQGLGSKIMSGAKSFLGSIFGGQ